jgi:CRISPR-associated protein Cas1
LKLIINEPGSFVGVKAGRISVRKKGKVISEVAAPLLEQVIVTTRGASFSSALVRLLARHHVQLFFLSGYGFPVARLVTGSQGSVMLRHMQYLSQENETGFNLAKLFVLAKINNQAVLLGSAGRNREENRADTARVLLDMSHEVRNHLRMVESLAYNPGWRKKLMSIEADASEIYWQGVAKILEGYTEFPGRKKRFDEPADPANIMLNYGYSFLASHVWMSVESVGLDPYAGFLHVDSPRRPALVMDMIEEFRQPVVDRAVFRIIMEKKDDIRLEGRKLSRESRIDLLKVISQRLEQKVTFENRCFPIESHITFQARRLAEAVMGRDTYVPYMER